MPNIKHILRKLGKNGGSLKVTIPNNIRKELNLDEGDHIKIILNKKKKEMLMKKVKWF